MVREGEVSICIHVCVRVTLGRHVLLVWDNVEDTLNADHAAFRALLHRILDEVSVACLWTCWLGVKKEMYMCGVSSGPDLSDVCVEMHTVLWDGGKED